MTATEENTRQRWISNLLVSVACLIAVISLFGCSAAVEQPLLTVPRQSLNLESFEYIWTTIRDQHYDPSFGGLDWQAVHDELRPEMENAQTMMEARTIMHEMISRLKLSHFSIIPGNLYENMDKSALQDAEPGVTGIDIRLIDDQVIVTRVEAGQPADKYGVRPGWQIVRIGKEDLSERVKLLAQAFESKAELNSIVTSRMKSRLTGISGDTIPVEFLDGNNKRVKLKIPLARQKGHKFKLGYLPTFYVWIKVKEIKPAIGYISFNAFFDPINVMPVYNKAMESFMENNGLIIDLRGNPGGMLGMVSGMISWLISEKNQILGTMYLRDNTLKTVINPRGITYSGPVAVLIDGLSASSSEIFAGGLQDLGRARIFGEPSAGAALLSNIVSLPNGDFFQYAIANYRLFSGKELEGKGIQPDVLVRPSRKALLEGRDPALEAAVAWIKGQSRPAG
ncbi:MAG: S41 family peptidase [Candidatus Adiutricales bacterium]